MLRDGQLRNKTLALSLGFPGLSVYEYEPLFTGLWIDGSVDWKKGSITIKTRSILQRFQKVQLPKELGGARSDTTVVPIVYTADNIVDVMLDLIDQLGVADRYIDRTSFTGLNGISGPLYGSDWNISRTLNKDNKKEIIKLLEELSVVSGVFIVQLPNGQLQAVYYDDTVTPTFTLESKLCDFGALDLGMAELYTRQAIYYTLIAGKSGGSAEDFEDLYLLINQTAEVDWGLNADVADTDPDYQKNPGYQKEWFDLWGMSANARIAMAARLDNWYATPKLRVSATKIPLQYWTEFNTGSIIYISGLPLPITGETWGTPCSNVKFLCLKKQLDPKTLTVNADFMLV